jgi:WD40 repeat protein
VAPNAWRIIAKSAPAGAVPAAISASGDWVLFNVDGDLFLQKTDGSPVLSFAHIEALANPVTISRDDQLVAGGTYDGKVVIWNAGTGQIDRTLSTDDSDGEFAEIRSVAIAPDKGMVAAGTRKGKIVVWDMASAQKIRQRSAKPEKGGYLI